MFDSPLFKILLIAVVLYGARQLYFGRELKHPPGILAAAEPLQLETPPKTFRHKGSIIDYLASYQIRARVLGNEPYYFDAAAEMSPADLALGWGPMSDSAVLDQLKISQNNRYYTFEWTGAPPLAEDVLRRSSANVHIVPATAQIAKQVSNLRKGDIVTLKGYLIRISSFNGGEWKSSLTREDSGKGACELIWLESVQ